MAETITTDNKSTLLYRFLVSPELRWARYLVLYGVGYHIIQSGFYYIPRLSGYIGRMDLYIHFLISTDLYRSYLSESFLALSKVFAEKTLSNLHILTFSSNDACPGNTNGNGICILFLLAWVS